MKNNNLNHCIPIVAHNFLLGLPAQKDLTAHTIYFIKSGEDIQMYVTDANAIPYLIGDGGEGGSPNLQKVLETGSDGSVPTNILLQSISSETSEGGMLSLYPEGFSLGNNAPEGYVGIQYPSGASGSPEGIEILDTKENKGLRYAQDYSAKQIVDDRSIPDVGAVKQLISEEIPNLQQVLDEGSYGLNIQDAILMTSTEAVSLGAINSSGSSQISMSPPDSGINSISTFVTSSPGVSSSINQKDTNIEFLIDNPTGDISLKLDDDSIIVKDEVNSKGITTSEDYSSKQILDDNAYTSTLAVKKLIKNSPTLKKVKYPTDLNFRPFNIYEANEKYIVSKKPKDLVKDKISKMKPYYVNYQSGSNSNSGLTEATPFKTIAVAYAAGARLIYLTGGIHKIDSWSLLNSAYTNTDDLFIIGIGKEPTIICSAPAITPTITLQSGTTYQATDANIRMVVDMKYLNEYGFPLRLTELFSISEVNSTLGSYYYDTVSSVLYFNLTDGRIPDNDILILTRLRNAEYRANAGYHYIENITFMGGGSTTGTHGVVSQQNVNSSLIHLAEKCNFIYGQALNYTSNGGEGTRNLYNKVNWFHNCIAYNNARDGFNYLADQGNRIYSVEVNCHSFENDWRQGANNSNGSSSHGPGNTIRVGSKYYRNSGPNVADVDGNIVLNVGCTLGESTASLITDTIYNTDFAVESNVGLPATKMYIYDCKSLNEELSYSITGIQPSYIYIHPTSINKGGTQIITPSAPQQIIEGEYPTSIEPSYIFPNLSTFVEATGIITQSITSGVIDLAPSSNAVFNALALKANLLSPGFTGVPTAPTAIAGTNTIQLATTAFVQAEKQNLQQVTQKGNTTIDKVGIGTSTIDTNAKIFKIGDGIPTDANNLFALTKTFNVDSGTVPSVGNNGVNIEITGIAQANFSGRASRALKAVGLVDPNGFTLTNNGGAAIGVEGVARINGTNGGSVYMATGGYWRVINQSGNVNLDWAITDYINSPLNNGGGTINGAVGLYVINHNLGGNIPVTIDALIGSPSNTVPSGLTGHWAVYNMSAFPSSQLSALKLGANTVPTEMLDVVGNGKFTGNVSALNATLGTHLATLSQVDSKVVDTIVDGVTTVAPSQNAVFDALALKAPINNASFTGSFTIPTGALSITGGSTNNYVRGDGSIAGTASAVRNTTVSSTTVATTPVAVGTSFDNALILLQNQVNLKLDTSLILTGSATLDFPSTAPGMSSELTIAVTGAAEGDVVALGTPNASTTVSTCFTARVSATNTVTVKLNNYSSVAVNPASGLFKVKIFK